MKIFPKILGGAFGIGAAVALSMTTTQAQNLLVNGSFENAGLFTANPAAADLSGINQGWDSSQFGTATAAQSSAYAQDGSYSLAVAAGTQTWNPSGSYEAVSGITAGTQYTLSIYVLAPVALTGTYSTPVDIQLQFMNSALANLSTVDLGWSPVTVGSWKQYSVTGIAPSGTVYAEPYVMFMENGSQSPNDTVYFDNASLVATPEPATIALLAMGLAFPLSLIRRRK